MPGIARVRKDSAMGLIVGPGSSTMIVDGSPVSLENDGISSHGKSPHTSPTLVLGYATTMLVDGKKPAMIGTGATCGHTVTTGSSKMDIS